jgi:hypothetical protein
LVLEVDNSFDRTVDRDLCLGPSGRGQIEDREKTSIRKREVRPREPSERELDQSLLEDEEARPALTTDGVLSPAACQSVTTTSPGVGVWSRVLRLMTMARITSGSLLYADEETTHAGRRFIRTRSE